MRKVTVKVWEPDGLSYVGRPGLFHRWGEELFEQTEGASVSYTVGIVELEDGSVFAAPPAHIKFNELPAEA